MPADVVETSAVSLVKQPVRPAVWVGVGFKVGTLSDFKKMPPGQLGDRVHVVFHGKSPKAVRRRFRKWLRDEPHASVLTLVVCRVRHTLDVE